MEITQGQIDEMLAESGKKCALNKALECVSRKVCSEKSLKYYLKGKGYDQKSIDFATAKVKEYGYINDEHYAKNFEVYGGRDKGRLKIVSDLKSRGIGEDIIGEIEFDPEKENEKCLAEAKKFIKGKEKNEKLREKLYRHLAYKGFDSETAMSALSAVLNYDSSGDNTDI